MFQKRSREPYPMSIRGSEQATRNSTSTFARPSVTVSNVSPPHTASPFTSPRSDEGQPAGTVSAHPPLNPTEIFCKLHTADGTILEPQIIAKIEKGFFLTRRQRWTCYRRNYFQLAAAYGLSPTPQSSTSLFVNFQGTTMQASAITVSVSAAADTPDGKPVDLLQYTAKRTKDAAYHPPKVALAPKTGSATSTNNRVSDGERYGYEQNVPHQINTIPVEHVFERVQFTIATQNNGKRRAAQQYYHLVVELHADLGPHMGDQRYVKLAHRVSAQVVVRGRSPGHYAAEDREESDGDAGAWNRSGHIGSSIAYPHAPGTSYGQPYDVTAGSNSSAVMQSNAYNNAYNTQGGQNQYPYDFMPALPALSFGVPSQALLNHDENKEFRAQPDFSYYSSNTMYEPHQARSSLPAAIPHPSFHEDSTSLLALSSPQGNGGRVKPTTSYHDNFSTTYGLASPTSSGRVRSDAYMLPSLPTTHDTPRQWNRHDAMNHWPTLSTHPPKDMVTQ